ncbi:unnamed protein product [Durusdinium trenchii]|uniref:Uncharacterized protein n=1 Tax=Durusdinium trenchii TaxID=1381693 RepID=A0ABP0J5U4_9DINO
MARWSPGGSHVFWDQATAGTDEVLQDLVAVQQTASPLLAFAGLKRDGSIVSWGHEDCVPSPEEQAQLAVPGAFRCIQSTDRHFCALRADGRGVFFWGHHAPENEPMDLGDRSIKEIQANGRAFAALLSDGSVKVWGEDSCGGHLPCDIERQLKKAEAPVVAIQANDRAFAAILKNGEVVTWGDVDHGGCTLNEMAKDAAEPPPGAAVAVAATRGAFAVLRSDGGVQCRGRARTWRKNKWSREMRKEGRAKSKKACTKGGGLDDEVSDIEDCNPYGDKTDLLKKVPKAYAGGKNERNDSTACNKSQIKECKGDVKECPVGKNGTNDSTDCGDSKQKASTGGSKECVVHKTTGTKDSAECDNSKQKDSKGGSKDCAVDKNGDYTDDTNPHIGSLKPTCGGKPCAIPMQGSRNREPEVETRKKVCKKDKDKGKGSCSPVLYSDSDAEEDGPLDMAELACSVTGSVVALQATHEAFAALRDDGSVVCWGLKAYGGDCSEVELKDVKAIQATSRAFAALRKDGSVVVWGHKRTGGELREDVRKQLQNVKEIQANDEAFAALLGDGTVITWGDEEYGGDSSSVQPLRNVHALAAVDGGFVALAAEDQIVTWGDCQLGPKSEKEVDQEEGEEEPVEEDELMEESEEADEEDQQDPKVPIMQQTSEPPAPKQPAAPHEEAPKRLRLRLGGRSSAAS